MKEILLKMLAELEDLRANQGLLNLVVAGQVSTGQARETKGLALQANHEFFDKLRKEIEGLA